MASSGSRKGSNCIDGRLGPWPSDDRGRVVGVSVFEFRIFALRTLITRSNVVNHVTIHISPVILQLKCGIHFVLAKMSTSYGVVVKGKDNRY